MYIIGIVHYIHYGLGLGLGVGVVPSMVKNTIMQDTRLLSVIETRRKGIMRHEPRMNAYITLTPALARPHLINQI